MKNFETYLKSKALAKKSIKSRMLVVRQFRKWLEKESLEAEQVTYNDIMLLMKHYQQSGLTQRTIQNYMSAVQHYFDHLIQQEVIMVNPVSDIKIKGVKRKLLYPVLEPHELHRLYNQYDEQSLKGRRNKVVVGLLVYQGLRVSEVAQLEVKHLKLREGKIDVPGGIRRDGRMMELESHQVMDMYEYMLQVRPELIKTEPVEKPPAKMDTDWLFIREGGYPLTEGGLGNYIVQLLKNIRKLNPSIRNGKHIRASVITRWLKTRNLREVQYLAGHRYISSTENYLQNNMEELIEEINQYHPLG